MLRQAAWRSKSIVEADLNPKFHTWLHKLIVFSDYTNCHRNFLFAKAANFNSSAVMR
jgi:hypothetical protein